MGDFNQIQCTDRSHKTQLGIIESRALKAQAPDRQWWKTVNFWVADWLKVEDSPRLLQEHAQVDLAHLT